MRLSFAICDHCHGTWHGVALTTYRVADGPLLEICAWCQQKPFRHVEPSARGKVIAETVRLALGAA